MFSNFTEEFASGINDVISLNGETPGNIKFSKSFTDGKLVSYAIRDAGNIIKVTGIGVYSGDTITRSDLWHYDGTDVVNNPASNIELNDGVHIVTCVQHVDNISDLITVVIQLEGQPMPARPQGYKVVYWHTFDEPTINGSNPFDKWANAVIVPDPEPTGDNILLTSDGDTFTTSDGDTFIVSI